MKVLIQNSLYFPNVIGGAEISSHLLGQELRRRGIAADAVATTGRTGGGRDIAVRPTADGLGTVYEADAHGLCDLLPDGDPGRQPGFLTRGLNHFAMVRSGRWRHLFDQVITRTGPDIIHTNTLVGLTPAIWAAAHRRGIPVVHTLRDYHLLCPRTTLLRSDNSECVSPPLPCRLLAGLKLRQTHTVAAVTAPSRFVLDRHLQAGGFQGARTAVVPNALEEWPQQIPSQPDSGRTRGLFMGQLNVHKGIPLLLEVLEALFQDPACANLDFDFAGSGPLAGLVEEFCSRHRDRARCHGMATGQAKLDLLSGAGFMVVPSVWAEPFSRVIVEGFSWGLPAIGSDRGGIPEVITHRRDGLVVAMQAEDLAGAIRTLASDSELRRELGMAARRRAADFTLDRQVDRFLELYRGLLGKEVADDLQG